MLVRPLFGVDLDKYCSYRQQKLNPIGTGFFEFLGGETYGEQRGLPGHMWGSRAAVGALGASVSLPVHPHQC